MPGKTAPTIYQSFIGGEQRALLSPAAVPHDAAHNDGHGTREYELFKGISAMRPEDGGPWGLVSWKFEHKTHIPLERFAQFAGEKFDQGCDCVFINPMIGNEAVFRHVWEQGARAHRGMERIAERLARWDPRTIGRVCGTGSFAFCNYFVGTPRFWRAYFAFVDSICAMLDDEARRSTEAGLAWTGSGRYLPDPRTTMRPFVIERLFSPFVRTHRELRFAAFRHPIAIYESKFGKRLGRLLHAASTLKNDALRSRDTDGLRRWNAIRMQIFQSRLHGPIVTMDDPPDLLLRADLVPMALHGRPAP